MDKEFKGVFGKTWWSLPLAASNILGLLGDNKLKILSDKLVVDYKGKEIELQKSQITQIKDVYFWGAIKIVNSNSNLPHNLIFYPLFSIGPLRTSTVAKALREAGYLNQ